MILDGRVKYTADGTPYIERITHRGKYTTKFYGEIFKCHGCGSDAFRAKSFPKQKYCTMKCRSQHVRHPQMGRPISSAHREKLLAGARRRYELLGPVNPKKRVKCTCKTCGKVFELCPSQIGRNMGKYCSRECYAVGQKGKTPWNKNKSWSQEVKHKISRIHHGKDEPWLNTKCHQCGKLFHRKPCYRDRYPMNFCSADCKNAWQSTQTGELANNWLGGKHDYGKGWGSMKLHESIRDRDGRKCRYCGKTEAENGRRLDVHHIDYNKKNMDRTNLMAACAYCNRIFNGDRPYWQKYLTAQMDWSLIGAGAVDTCDPNLELTLVS